MRIYSSLLAAMLCIPGMFAQKTPALKFIKEITIPAGSINLRNYWKDRPVRVCDDLPFYDVINELTKEDSIYAFPSLTFYVYQNINDSELEVMKALGEVHPLRLATKHDQQEIKNRLALIASILKCKKPSKSTMPFHPLDSIGIYEMGYICLTDGLIFNITLGSNLMKDGWSMGLGEQTGRLENYQHLWFISRRKPTKQELAIE
jgi:hypothetical protein